MGDGQAYGNTGSINNRIKILMTFTESFLRGNLNGNGVSADAGDLVLMKRASIGEIQADSSYGLNAI